MKRFALIVLAVLLAITALPNVADAFFGDVVRVRRGLFGRNVTVIRDGGRIRGNVGVVGGNAFFAAPVVRSNFVVPQQSFIVPQTQFFSVPQPVLVPQQQFIVPQQFVVPQFQSFGTFRHGCF